MATLIGVVSQVVGEVFAVASDGARRPLSEGDRLYAGEQLVTGAAGAVAVTMSNGQQLTLGRDSSLMLDEQMLASRPDGQPAESAAATDAPSERDLTDVEQLQAAIEAGVDPTLEGEATAAGPGAGGAAGGGGGGHSFVLLGEVGGALDPVIGYPTEGLSFVPEFPDPEVEIAADEEPAPDFIPDFIPDIDIEYQNSVGQVITGPAVVDEAALAEGSNPSSPAEQASGRLIISSPDGVSAVQIQDVNGTWVNVTNGGVVQGQYGILTVDVAGNWVYTLSGNTLDHDNPNGTGSADQVGESFPVRMFDLDGDVSPTVSLSVLVNDDGPTAVNDSNSLGEDDASVGGNVLTNDTAGADGGKTVTTPGSYTGTYGQLVLNEDGSYTYTLYTDSATQAILQGLSEGESLSESFGYGMQDADGDSSSATLTLTIQGADDGVTITGLDLDGGEVLVDEDDLPNGTDQSDPLSQSGTFAITAPDGIATVSIGGVSFTYAQLANSGSVNLLVDSPAGVLVINGYSGSASGGTVSYTYTLQDPVSNALGSDQANESFAVIVTDADGSSDTDSLDVTIIDDQPVAVNDSNSLGEDDASVGGNVLTNDIGGADGGKTVTTPGTSNGSYGQFVLGANGAYTYTLNTSLVQGLDSGETLTETFSYTMRDADDDESSATVTITIVGSNDVPSITVDPGNGGANDTVYESGLPTGSDAGANSEFASGTFTLSDADGLDDLQSVTINGVTVNIGSLAGSSFTGDSGTLTVTAYDPDTGIASYTYQLTSPTTDGPGTETDVFTLTVSDGTASSAPADITIEIIDDVPTARDNEACTVENGLPPFNLTLILDSSGTMNDAVMADLGNGMVSTTRLEVAKAALIDLINSYMALGVPLNIKIIDFDTDANLVYEGSDAASAQAAISALAAGGYTNYEEALNLARSELEADLADPDLAGYVNRVYFLSDGQPNPPSADAPADWQAFVDANNIDVIAVGIQIPSGGAAENELKEVANAGDTVIVVQDPNDLSATLGETVPDVLQGNVITDAGPGGPDDVDVSGADSPVRVTEVSFVSNGGIVTYSVPNGGSTGPIITPAGGTLIMASDGSYSYAAPDNVTENIEEVFTYTIIDADGDTSSATLTICVEDGVPLAVDDIASMTEDTDQISGNVITNDDLGTDAPGSVHFSNTSGTYGNLIFNPAGGWTYDLNNANPVVQGLGVGESLTEVFSYILTDADGDTSSATLTITIHGADDGVTISGLTPALQGGDAVVDEDDLPNGTDPVKESTTVTGDFQITAPDGIASLSIDGLGSPTVISFAALANSGSVPIVITTDLGNTLTITGYSGDAFGGSVSYSYELLDNEIHANGDGENDLFDNLAVVVTDVDGSSASDVLSIRIVDDVPSVEAASNQGAVAVLDETATTSGSASIDTGLIAKGDDPDVPGVGYIGQALSSGALVTLSEEAFGADGPALDGAKVYSLTVENTDSGLQVTDGSAIHLVLLASGVVVGVVAGGAFDGQAAFAIQIDDATGVATVEQYLSLKHPNDSDPDDVLSLAEGALGVQVTLTDGDGDSVTSTVVDVSGQIAFHDDGPQFHSVMDAVLSAATDIRFDGLYDASFGADGLDFLSVALAAGGSYAGQPVSFIQLPTAEVGVTEVEVTNGSNEVLFSFYYKITSDPVSGGGDGSVVFEAFGSLADPANSQFFTLTVNPDGTYTFEMLSNEIISSTTVTGEDFGAFGPVGEVSTMDGSLTIFGGKDASTPQNVNASQNGIGVKEATIDKGEWMRFDFLKQQSFVSFSVQQFGGSGAAILMFTIDGVVFDFNTAAAGVQNLSLTKPASGTGMFEVVVDTNLAGTWTSDGTTYTLYVANEFEELRIDHEDGGVKFNVNNITYDLTTTIEDLSLNFGLSTTDMDGDTATLDDDLTITMLDPDVVLTATADGTDADGGVVLVGNGDPDTLIGGAGDDILIGGHNSDLMTGGAGSDTFKWLQGDDAVASTVDTITDFFAGYNSGGDRLDLSELLIGEDGNGGPDDIGNLLSYIDISTANLGGTVALDTVIKVDASGGGDFASPDQTIVLQDVDLFAAYGPGATESSIISGMLGDGTLKVDTV